MFGGVLSSENHKSIVSFENSTFELNYAMISKLSVGAGAVLMKKGDLYSKLSTKNCLFKDSGISLRGKIIIYFILTFIN